MMQAVGYALRVLRKDPGFTLVAIGSLALGIGATSAGFSFADALLLRPLPVLRPDRVVAINTARPTSTVANSPISYPDYADLRDHNHSFEGLVAASYTKFGFSSDPRTLPRMKFGLFVSGNFFRVLGVEPALGRGFRPDEDRVEGRDAVAVLGHDFWVSQFDASRSVLGSRIRLNGVEFTVIGVAPESFTGIDTILRPELFVPIAMAPRIALHDRDAGWLLVKGRLKPGVTVEQANADVSATSAALQKLHKEINPDRRLVVETELQFRINQGPHLPAMSNMLILLGVCVLLVACANVAGLLLSRARARSREIAVRLAVGAGRVALVRQLLLENLLVAIAGGLGGVAVADAIASFWRSMPVPSDFPVVFAIGVDRRVLLVTLAVSVLSTLLFGLAPALRATRPDLVPALKSIDADSAGRRRLWGRNAIVAAQIALSMILLAVSGVLVEGFRSTLAQGPGYRTDRLLLTCFDTQMAHYTEEQTRQFYDNLLTRVRSDSRVRSAALAWPTPMVAIEKLESFPEGWPPPRGNKPLTSNAAYVSEGYFHTLSIAIVDGREFRQSDRPDSPLVAVVNEQMASHYWPGKSALGKRFHLGALDGPLVEVVGIAKMSKYGWIAEPPADVVYVPFRQHPRPMLQLVMESNAADAGTLVPVMRDAVRGLDPDMPVFDVRTMRDFYLQRGVRTPNMIVEVVAGLGLMGLALAVIGVYGLVAYSVSRRTREIGIRMAMGAERQGVVWMVLHQGLRLGAAGVAVGVVIGFLAGRAVTSSSAVWAGGAREGVNPLVLAGTALTLLAMTMLAAWAPARRASQIDPMRALHDE
jgi:predicted permease